MPLFPTAPKRADAIYVENNSAVQDILDDLLSIKSGTHASHYNKRYKPKHSLETDSFVKSKYLAEQLSPNLAMQQKLLREQLEVKAKQLDDATKANIQKGLQQKEQKYENNYKNLSANVEESKAFLDDLDKELNVFYETKKNKVRRQFEEWNTNVHGSIQVNIANQVSAIDSKKLNRRKNRDYKKFLDITNRKSAIFRDIIIESEYDPLEPNRRSIKAKISILKDPTLLDQQKADSEGGMLGGKKKNLRRGKDTLPVELWASGKIEATPYGMFAKMMKTGDEEDGFNFDAGGSSSAVAQSTKGVAMTKSSVVFNHFEYPVGRDALDSEMPRGKRVYPKKIWADAGDLTPDVLKELEKIRLPF